ncbi:MAG: AMP-binding protein, partial [Rhodospirillum sp.]|nr:AMP-binding protein [Rhodospirillum sp.]
MDGFRENIGPRETCLSLLWARAEVQGRHPALTLPTAGEMGEVTLDFATLTAESDTLAARLRPLAAPGDRVLLLFENSLGFALAFLACLRLRLVAVPAPRDGERERLEGIVQDCHPRLVLYEVPGDGGLAEGEGGDCAPDANWYSLGATPLLDSESDGGKGAKAALDLPLPGSKDPAVLQYTSGSTTQPRGVIVTHGMMAANQWNLNEAMGFRPGDLTVSWLPVFHDMGLFGGLLQTMLHGERTVLLSRRVMLRDPLRWLQAISRYGATHSGAPNFAYDACVDALKRRLADGEAPPDLDLSRWRVAFNGAEPVRATTMRRFAQAFAPHGFRAEMLYPTYGMAEATLFVTGSRPGEIPLIRAYAGLETGRACPIAPGGVSGDRGGVTLVSSGRPVAGTVVRVVDPESRRLLEDRHVGEIWVSGPQVARAYQGAPNLSAAILNAVLEDGTGPYLRTRDLGFLDGQELFVTGRMGDLIVLHGRNLYPQDLEGLAQAAHPGIEPGCVAAFRLEEDWTGPPKVILVIGRRKGTLGGDPDALAEAAREAVWRALEVAPHDVVVIPRNEVVRTSSGKIRRGALRDALREGRLTRLNGTSGGEGDPPGLVPPRRDALEALGRDVEAVLGGASPSLDPARPLFSQGLDSLSLLALSDRLERRHGAPPPGPLLYAERAGVLADWMAIRPPLPGWDAPRGAGVPVPDLLLGRGRGALLFQDQGRWDMVTLSTLVLRRGVSVAAVAEALVGLVARHPPLGYRIDPAGDRFQVGFVTPPPLENLEREEGESAAALERRLWIRARRPLDLSRGSPFRLVLGPEAGTGGRPAVLAVHHLICDARSLDQGTRDFLALIEGTPLSRGPVTPPEVTGGEEAALASALRDTALAGWRDDLEGVPPSARFPWPAPIPGGPGEGGLPVRRFALSEATARRLDALGTRLGLGATALHLAAWWAALVRLGAPERLAVVLMADLRDHSSDQGAKVPLGLGYAVNPLPLVLESPGAEATLIDVARGIQHRLSLALERRILPFAQVIEALDPPRGGPHGPYQQIQFGHGRLSTPVALDLSEALAMEGAVGVLLPQMEGLALANLQVFDTPTGIRGMLVYDPAHLRADTAASLEAAYRTFIEALAGDGAKAPLDRLPLVEPRPSLGTWENGPPEPVHVTARRLADANPKGLAVIDGDIRLDNGTLWRWVDSLAIRLDSLGRGVARERPIATLIPRSAAFLASQLAILEVGRPVMPLDPDTPPDRLGEMLTDADPLALIAVVEGVDWHGPILSPGAPPIQGDFPTRNRGTVALSDPAYVIHTSGSTGRPKGVVFPHGGLASRLADLAGRMEIRPGDRVLNYISPAFDPSVQEILMAVTTGSALVVAPQGNGFDPGAVAGLMAREGVTHGVGIPSMLLEVVSHPAFSGCRTLRSVTCGGETLTAALRDRFVAGSGGRLLNVYGATETTICATVWDATEVSPERVSAVGVPMADTVARVVDDLGRPLPPGVVGEILIGGAALSLGYLDRSDETAARFPRDPLSPDGGPLYRTGDAGWLDGEGVLWFAGRLDGQVKINGQRVELEEIANRLRATNGVSEAIVVLRPRDGEGGKELVAYVVAAGMDGRRLDTPTLGSTLRRGLSRSLPPHLCPSAYVVLDRLPLTRNGKVDRAALPEPGPEHRIGGLSDEAAGWDDRQGGQDDPMVRAVSAIWAEALGLERVDPGKSFFALGGHSLLALKVVARIEAELGRRLPPTTLYGASSVEEVVTLLREMEGDAGVDQGPVLGLHHRLIRPRVRQRREGADPYSLSLPLYLVAPGVRGMAAYDRLARVLAPGRAIHCLAAPGPGVEPGIVTLADLSRWFADRITEGGSGPIHLMGYSIGGLAAYELARELGRRSIPVASLVLVGSLDSRWT